VKLDELDYIGPIEGSGYVLLMFNVDRPGSDLHRTTRSVKVDRPGSDLHRTTRSVKVEL
jgi:hypothetical protein